MRVAVGAVFTESNHLVGTLTDMACFERTELRRGADVLAATDGVLGGAGRVLGLDAWIMPWLHRWWNGTGLARKTYWYLGEPRRKK
jgi:hypothetical protein